MKLLFVSLGCDKNLVDSEEMLGLLTGNGFEIVDDETEAEAIVVNTCCFINDAKEESVNTILEMAEYKKTGSCKVLVVTGCMAQRYKNEIIEEVPEVDAVLGTTSYGDILLFIYCVTISSYSSVVSSAVSAVSVISEACADSSVCASAVCSVPSSSSSSGARIFTFPL